MCAIVKKKKQEQKGESSIDLSYHTTYTHKKMLYEYAVESKAEKNRPNENSKSVENVSVFVFFRYFMDHSFWSF